MSGVNGHAVTIASIMALPRWVAWQTEEREAGAKPTKIPYSPDGFRAMANDPATWGTRAAAERRANSLPKPFGLGGVGIEFGDLGNGWCLGGIDLDTCRADDGTFSPWARMVMDRFASYTEVSPSGTGAKVYFTYRTADLPALREATGTQHGKTWQRTEGHDGAHPPAIELHLGNRYFAWTGKHLAETPLELRPVKLDTLLWLIREAGPSFAVKKPASAAKVPAARAAPVAAASDELLERIEEKAARYPKLAQRWSGDWDGVEDQSGSGLAFSLGSTLKIAGFNRSEVEAALRAHHDTAQWADRSDARAFDRIFERGGNKLNQDGAEFTAPDEADWRKQLQRTDKGAVRTNLFNACVALEHAPEWQNRIALDELADAVTLRAAPPWQRAGEDFKPRAMKDADFIWLAVWLQSIGIQVSSAIAAEAAVSVAQRNRFNPVGDYLNGLKWDGAPRIDTWLSEHLGVEDTPYTRAVAAKSLIAAVARALDPGCKVDTVPLLEGPQGIGKSTALRALFGGDWFVDHMPDLQSKDAMLQLQGVWCVEFAELDKLGKAEASRAKSFITTPIDKLRRPYGRVTEVVPRRCVFWGTLNPGGAGYLRDETGNRRYWPVACAAGWEPGRKADTAALAAVRDQLWAEAVARRAQGEAHWFTDAALEAVQAQAVEARFDDDAWASTIHAFIAGWSDVSGAEVLEQCLGKPRGSWQRQDQMRVGAVMNAAGWRRKQVSVAGGKREWRYFNPVATDCTTSEPGLHHLHHLGSAGGAAESQAISTLSPPAPPAPLDSFKWEGGDDCRHRTLGIQESSGAVMQGGAGGDAPAWAHLDPAAAEFLRGMLP